MAKFNISITYEKTIEAFNKEDAERILERIESKSNLDDEYGPFSSLDVFTTVEQLND